jgi:thiamine-monophosphate kinase
MTSTPTEWRLLAIIRERLARAAPAPAHVRIDIGDDAAALAWSGGDVVCSVDAAVEGVHFRREWLTLEQIGARAFTAAVSDLAAMGSEPRGALVALALPGAITEDDVGALAEGLARASARYGCPIVGGNLTRASEISITTTVLGSGARHLLRSGAQVGDDVFVSGVVGAAGLGLALLAAGEREREGAAPFIERFGSPTARIALGLSLVGRATAAIDLSDGLASDLAHVLALSGVAAELDVARLPLAVDHADVAAQLGLDPIELALRGGEDYELLFTLPAGTEPPPETTRIGRITRGAGTIELVLPDGTRRPAKAQGHDHFG